MDSNSRTFSFGPFVLDIDGAELRKGSDKVALRPKCFDVLVYLLERRGRLVSKQELLDNLWADVVVNDGTLNRTVIELRDALGDDSDHPRYIQTVPRRGYKFMAEERESGDSQQEAANFALVYRDHPYPLVEGAQIIGRGKDAAFAMYGGTTSREHARIVVEGSRVTLENLSRHGTSVNGTAVAGVVELHTGDEIRMGNDVLVLWSRASETASLR